MMRQIWPCGYIDTQAYDEAMSPKAIDSTQSLSMNGGTRRPYRTPRLLLYGAVSSLTASGSGIQTENVKMGKGTSGCTPQTFKARC
jgi:hypothetical protein